MEFIGTTERRGYGTRNTSEQPENPALENALFIRFIRNSDNTIFR